VLNKERKLWKKRFFSIIPEQIELRLQDRFIWAHLTCLCHIWKINYHPDSKRRCH